MSVYANSSHIRHCFLPYQMRSPKCEKRRACGVSGLASFHCFTSIRPRSPTRVYHFCAVSYLDRMTKRVIFTYVGKPPVSSWLHVQSTNKMAMQQHGGQAHLGYKLVVEHTHISFLHSLLQILYVFTLFVQHSKSSI